ncbi:MAG TPA: low temperature requirement protein A [Pyrinomonadaceae bacterium]|nr:low temperature requirement protein A [Pyrinomonadaceae bacterium]
MAEAPSRIGGNRPRLRTFDVGERHASWLELFFDLVFVLAVAQVARILADHSDLGGFVRYVALFLPVWWSWVGFTFYADRFESEEPTYRILMFSGMLTVIGFAIALGDAFTPRGDVAVVVCYVLMRIVLSTLYLRVAYYVPLARSFSLQYPIGLGVSSLILLASLLASGNLRYAMWGLAFAVELLTPLLNLRAARILPIDRSHIPERFGLFTIIVLGEAVVATGMGLAGVEWNFATVATACLGFAMAASIWWINFDFVEERALISGSLGRRFSYLYGHFFIVASIVATGIGVEHAIKEATEAHLHIPSVALMIGGVAVYIAAITAIRLITGTCKLVWPRFISIAVLIALVFASSFFPPLLVVAITLFVLIVELGIENYFSGEEKEEEDPVHLRPCEHAGEMVIYEARSVGGCEKCVENGYKWVHLRLCLGCGHVGCCDTSQYKHATKHFLESDHPIMASLETGETWAWCYVDERFVPLNERVSGG